MLHICEAFIFVKLHICSCRTLSKLRGRCEFHISWRSWSLPIGTGAVEWSCSTWLLLMMDHVCFFTIYILYIHTSLFVVHTVDSLESSTPPFRNRRIWGPNLRSSFVGSCFNPAAAVPDLCFGKVETCFQIPAAKTPISNRKHSRW